MSFDELNIKENAAIASNLASKIYNLDILESNFQDSANNVTRFLIMSNELKLPKVDEINLMTTLVFFEYQLDQIFQIVGF